MHQFSKPTMNDVARLAGVTQATVSHVINGTVNVSPETEKKVLAAIEKLGYLPNATARGLKMNRTNTVGIVVPEIESGYYSMLVNQLSKGLRDSGYMYFLCNTFYDKEVERQTVQALIELNVAGIVCCYGFFNTTLYKDIRRFRVPLVMVDMHNDDSFAEIPTVETDNETAAEMMVQHVYETGARRVTVASEPLANHMLKVRLDSYVDAIHRYGLTLEQEDFFIADHFYNKTNMVYDISLNILRRPLTDAICAVTDSLAIGIMRRLVENGLRVPEDVILTGFDDISMCLFVTPNLTTIVQPIEEVTVHVVELLLDLIHDRKIQRKHVVVPPRLAVRGSSVKGADSERLRVVDG